MGDLGRTLLIWIVAMLLPLQGMASAGGFLCSPGHGGTLPTVAAVAAEQAMHAQHGRQGRKAGPVADAAHAHHAAFGAGVTSSAEVQNGGTSHHQAEDRCSTCSDCCAGAALPTSPATLAAVEQAGPVRAAPGGGAASVIACGLERPPRG